jgi:hypothetical protein
MIQVLYFIPNSGPWRMPELSSAQAAARYLALRGERLQGGPVRGVVTDDPRESFNKAIAINNRRGGSAINRFKEKHPLWKIAVILTMAQFLRLIFGFLSNFWTD